MTDPQTSYENRDAIRAVDHDRIGLMLRLLWVILPLAVTAVFASGAAWFRLEELEIKQNALEVKIEGVIDENARTDRLAARLDERSETTLRHIQRIERILEKMQSTAPSAP